MPYIAPKPTTANVLATAAIWSGSGDTSGAMRLLNAHGLTVADMRSYLISKRGLLNGLGAPPNPCMSGMGRFHIGNPFKSVAAAVQKVVGSTYSAVMKPAEIAQSLAKGKPSGSYNQGVQSYTDSAGDPITQAQYTQLMAQWAAQGYQAAPAPTVAPPMSPPPLASPSVAAQYVQPAAPVYPVSNLPASVNPANNAPLPNSSDGSTGDNSGGGDTGYQDAASLFMNGLGRFKHYAPQGMRQLRHNPAVAGLGVASPAPAGPTAQPDIAAQLNQISIDWPSGTLWIGANKYSILTTLIGGLIVKGLMWGLSKGGNALKGAPALGVPAKKGRA